MKLPSERVVTENSRTAYALNKLKQNILAVDTLDAFTAQLLRNNTDVVQGLWISSLGVSARAGFEDVYNLSPRDYVQLIQDISMVRNKEEQLLIVDADNGGQSHKNTRYAFELYAQLGVDLGIVENKRGVKYNSVDASATKLHQLEDNSVFADKINAAKKQEVALVAARIENGILNEEDSEKAVEESMQVTDYLYKNARPDMYVFHWKTSDPATPVLFAKKYHEKYSSDDNRPLLGCIPTTYSKNISNQQLFRSGYNLIVYGNILLRSQMKSVLDALNSIQANDSTRRLDEELPNLKELFSLVYRK